MGIVCVFPGSFDPITAGHMDIIRRCSALFDRVVVAVLKNPNKTGIFPLDMRLSLIQKACRDMENVSVDTFGGLLMDFAKMRGAQVIVRGLRAVSDFENEFQMAQVNHQINPEIETMFMMTLPEHAYISSSVVRELGAHGGDLSPFVPDVILSDVSGHLSGGTKKDKG